MFEEKIELYKGEEINNLTPKYLGELLFDDIPWLPLAKKEHQAFANEFIQAGVKVVYLVDLVVQALDTSEKVKEEFIDEFIKETNIQSETLTKILKKYLLEIKDTKELVVKTQSGIKVSELPNYKLRTLTDFVKEGKFIANPMPNLYFTRDPFVVLNDGIILNKMHSITRSRETIYAKYIFKYHPIYHNTNLFYDRTNSFNIEGGDILILNKKALIIGVSERTSPEAIELLAKNLFFKSNTEYENIIVLTIPHLRTFMHLDTVLTQLDVDKFAVHKECYDQFKIYNVVIDTTRKDKLKVLPLKDKLDVVLSRLLRKDITIIPCGGLDPVSADREQWSDASNFICISPGEVIAYERNEITNELLRSYGIKVHTIPSSELSRGRGGPRCMCIPLEREDIK
mgnify:CR=1 FL=1